MVLELTTEEVELLRDILVHMVEENDWEYLNSKLLEAKVLMDYDSNLSAKLNEIYNKLY